MLETQKPNGTYDTVTCTKCHFCLVVIDIFQATLFIVRVSIFYSCDWSVPVSVYALVLGVAINSLKHPSINQRQHWLPNMMMFIYWSSNGCSQVYLHYILSPVSINIVVSSIVRILISFFYVLAVSIKQWLLGNVKTDEKILDWFKLRLALSLCSIHS